MCIESDELEISAWLKSYDEEYDALPRHELTIFLSFSDEAADIAAALLRKWMTVQTEPEIMQSFIDETIPPSPPDPDS